MNNDGSRKPGLPGRIGIALAVLGAASAVFVIAALAGGPGSGFPASAGRLLTRPLGWAALCLPAFLFFAAGVLFLPGYRKDLLVLLSGAPLPFLILVFLARFLAEPGPWYDAYPLLEALGLPGTAALGALVLLLSIALLLRLKGLAGRGDGGLAEPDGSASARTVTKIVAAPGDSVTTARREPEGSASGFSKFIPLVPAEGDELFPVSGLTPPAALGGREAESCGSLRSPDLPDPDGESVAEGPFDPTPEAQAVPEWNTNAEGSEEAPIPVLLRSAGTGKSRDSEAGLGSDAEFEVGPVLRPESGLRPPLLSGVAADPTAEAEMRPSRGSPFGSRAP
ncbi:MAG: hypothetical protein GX430_04300, partial [Treponema sp.]|nr:hypothetical protein [Treponema sp.]